MAKVTICFTLLAVLVSLTSAYNNEGDECYADDPKYYGYYAPHPIYCYRFLQCVHGRFVGRTCSPGLFWNQEDGACDFPANVHCEGQTTQRSTTTTTAATTTGTTTTTTYYPTTEYETTYPESYDV
ncbi:peritrophin-1-like [Bradysia coprophila]|uniref:peritrophin-1-like n=1 Tax=Bradysia coprophila TaxID=38358 RepID=UPI00187DBB6D|nr:peritrophin-1-like [Bradysia coprophila]